MYSFCCIFVSTKQRSNNAKLEKKQKIMTTFSSLSKEAKAEMAIEMVIMDAIEKGHTNPAELCEYMKSDLFVSAVENYINLMA